MDKLRNIDFESLANKASGHLKTATSYAGQRLEEAKK